MYRHLEYINLWLSFLIAKVSLIVSEWFDEHLAFLVLWTNNTNTSFRWPGHHRWTEMDEVTVLSGDLNLWNWPHFSEKKNGTRWQPYGIEYYPTFLPHWDLKIGRFNVPVLCGTVLSTSLFLSNPSFQQLQHCCMCVPLPSASGDPYLSNSHLVIQVIDT